jgi:hypothetical protein
MGHNAISIIRFGNLAGQAAQEPTQAIDSCALSWHAERVKYKRGSAAS